MATNTIACSRSSIHEKGPRFQNGEFPHETVLQSQRLLCLYVCGLSNSVCQINKFVLHSLKGAQQAFARSQSSCECLRVHFLSSRGGDISQIIVIYIHSRALESNFLVVVVNAAIPWCLVSNCTQHLWRLSSTFYSHSYSLRSNSWLMCKSRALVTKT